MKVFTPHAVEQREPTLSLQRGDSVVHRLLRPEEAYLLSESVAARVDELLRDGLLNGVLAEAEERPPTEKTERILVIPQGEPGDVICVRPAYAWWMEQKKSCLTEIAFVPTMGDECLLPALSSPIFDFPITLRQAERYDAWLEVDTRAEPHREIPEVFAEAIGLEATEPLWFLQNPTMAPAFEALLAETERPRIGVVIYSASHYRSWQAAHACITMAGLVETGCDCYMIGDSTKRVRFKKGDEEQRLWGDGMYDLHGLLPTMQEKVAFLSHMDVVIAPDCGLLQVACALGKPTVGLFGPTAGEFRTKYAPTLKVIQAEKSCSPCWCVGDRPPCECKWCQAITDLEPETIVETVKTILKERTDAT